MKKNNFTGWKDVFLFTLIQNFKSKSTIIITVVLFLVSLFLLPVVTAFTGNDVVSKSSIQTVRVINETDVDISTGLSSVLGEEEAYREITYEMGSKDKKKEEEELKNADDSSAVILLIMTYDSENGYKAELKYGGDTKVSSRDVEEYSYSLMEKFPQIMAAAFEVTPQQMGIVEQAVETEVKSVDAEDIKAQEGQQGKDEEESDELKEKHYAVMLTLICVITMLVSFVGEGIAGEVITEKSSKIVEFLLTSIRPMAIIVGKVAAIFVTVLTEIVLVGIGMSGSYLLNGYLHGSMSVKSMPGGLQTVLSKEVLGGLGAGNIVIAFALLLLGLLLYGMFAGLVGSMVNKMEEMAEGLKLYSAVMIVGAYGALAIAIVEMAGNCPAVFKVLASLFPITAPFCLPPFLLIGDINLITAVFAVILMVISLMLLTVFTSNVYEEIIYHNGEKLKMRDVVRIFRNKRKGEPTHE